MPDFGLPQLQLRINPQTGQLELDTPGPQTTTTIDPVTGQPVQTGLGQALVPQGLPPVPGPYTPQGTAPGLPPPPPGPYQPALRGAAGVAANNIVNPPFTGPPENIGPVPQPAPTPAPAASPGGSAVEQIAAAQQPGIGDLDPAENISAWDHALEQLSGPTATAFLAQLGLGLLKPIQPGSTKGQVIADAGLEALKGQQVRTQLKSRRDTAAARGERETRALDLKESTQEDTVRQKGEELEIKRGNAASLKKYREDLGAAAGKTSASKQSANVAFTGLIADALMGQAEANNRTLSRDDATLKAVEMVKSTQGKTREQWIGEQVASVVDLDGEEGITPTTVGNLAATWDAIHQTEAGGEGGTTGGLTYDPATGTFK